MTRLIQAADLGREDWLQVKSLAEQFEEAWQAGRRPPLDSYLPAGGPQRRLLLVELVHMDLEYRLKAGEPVRVEAYWQRYPELGDEPALELDLIREEYALRRRLEPGLGRAEYLARFPQYGPRLLAEWEGNSPGETESRLPQLPSPPCGGRGACGTDSDPAPETGKRGSGNTAARSVPAMPSRLGKYQLLEVLGAGSFGVVYRARDTELRRTVAVKVPRAAGLASREEAERFLREARSAAQLQHPHIVVLHDVHQGEGGCYLVYEFIEGRTLAERLRAGGLGFREAAELLAQTAEALDYAHRHGVIHRDLKPANILLDTAGRPHIMDLGLAKWETAETRLTVEGEVLGTPAYMAPEQALGHAHRVDARSDVYSLGVILYELLTGEVPFRGDSRMVLRQVVEEEPRPPRRLQDRIPRDLETICLKCLHKEPAWRYGSALALAEDLRRFLAGRPVQARPLGTVGKLWRACRRRPLPAALAAALLLVAVLGFAGVTWQWRLARAHLVEAQRQRGEAERNFQQAYQAVTDFTRFWYQDQLAEAPNLRPVRKALGEKALHYFEDFLRQGHTNPALRTEVASAYGIMGQIAYREKEPPARVLDAFRKALPIWEQLAAEDPATPRYRVEQAEICWRMALQQDDIGQRSQALRSTHRACDLFEQVAREQPDAAEFQRGLVRGYALLGDLLFRRNHYEEGFRSLRQAYALLERLARQNPSNSGLQRELALLAVHLADREREAGLVAAGRGTSQEAQSLWKRLLRERADLSSLRWESPRDPRRLALLFQEAESYRDLGRLKRDGGRPTEAVAAHQKAIGLLRELLRQDPSHLDYQEKLAFNVGFLARAQSETDHIPESIASYKEAVALWQHLAHEQPLLVGCRVCLADCYHSLGTVCEDSGRLAEAVGFYRQALAIREKLCSESGGDLRRRSQLGDTQYSLGEALEKLGRWDEALAAYQLALGHQRAHVAAAPGVAKHRHCLADYYLSLARVQRDSRHPAEALAALAEAAKLWSGGLSELDALARELAHSLLTLATGKPEKRTAPRGP